MTSVELLATGPELIKKGIRGFEPVLEESIIEANTEIHIMAYIFTSRALHILDLLEKAAERGIKIKMIINDLNSQETTIKSRFKNLSQKFSHVEIFDFRDPQGRQLHAKIIVIDRKKTIVSSANFS
jgi:phosphatidylserine/phosphatidylglycerophosphate/cardiolipin synthase-like enzyme